MKSLMASVAALLTVTMPMAAQQPLPDFRLPDVNTNSPRARVMVSPRDYLLQVSGYYFGAAG